LPHYILPLLPTRRSSDLSASIPVSSARCPVVEGNVRASSISWSTHEAKSTPGPRIIALPLRQSSDYSITEPDAVGGQALSRRKTPPTAGSVRDGSGVPRPSGGDGGRTRVPTADHGSWPGRHHLGGGIRR